MFVVLSSPDFRAFSRLSHRRVVTVAARGFHSGAVIPFPDELLIHPVLLKFERTHENIGVLPAFLENLNQASAMAEGIEVRRDIRKAAELIQEVLLAILKLAHDGFAAGKHAIRLQIPASADVPFAFLHGFLDILE